MIEGLALWFAFGTGVVVGAGSMTLMARCFSIWGRKPEQRPLSSREQSRVDGPQQGTGQGRPETVTTVLHHASALVHALQHADVPFAPQAAQGLHSTKLPSMGTTSASDSLGAVADKAQRLVELMHGQEHSLVSGTISAETVKETLKSLGAAANVVDNQFAQLAPFFTQAALDNQAVTGHLQSLQDQGRIFLTRSIAAIDEWQGMQALLGNFATATGTLRECIAVVQELASRAKLLSLNAAIVASQSQEHGRGFSVVADQIKGLSQRAAGATEAMQGGVLGVSHFSEQLATLFEQQQATLHCVRDDLQTVQELTSQAASSNGILAQRLEARAASAAGDGDPALERMRESCSRLMGELVEYSAALRLQDKEVKRVRQLADDILHTSSNKAHDAALALSPTATEQAWLACASWQDHHLQQMRSLGDLQALLAQASSRAARAELA